MAEKATQINHIGVIMDGNRRWARQHKFDAVIKGHEKGVDKFMELCMWCQESRIKNLTVYAFSYDNWNRSDEEVDGLMDLMERFFRSKVQTCINRGIRLVPIGNFERMSQKSKDTLFNAAEMTKDCTSLTVNVAMSYGGHDETVRIAKKIASDVSEGKLKLEDITQETYSKYLDVAHSGEMELVIRTGGDFRLSGFFPWETCYAEMMCLDVLWPDFSHEQFDWCVEQYYAKTRINKGK